MTAQGVLALYCQEPGCAVELAYRGYGRPPRWCDAHYPRRAPARLPHPKPAHEVPAARRTDPETSHQAAESVPAGAVEARVLAMFRLFQALTDDELADQLPEHHPPTTKSARSRLSKAGVLFDSGMRRPSNRGRQMIVWELRA